MRHGSSVGILSSPAGCLCGAMCAAYGNFWGANGNLMAMTWGLRENPSRPDKVPTGVLKTMGPHQEFHRHDIDIRHGPH